MMSDSSAKKIARKVITLPSILNDASILDFVKSEGKNKDFQPSKLCLLNILFSDHFFDDVVKQGE
jgi:hypothetical protein